MSDETYLTPVEDLKNTDLDFNRFKEIYDRDAEDTHEKLITFIMTQAQTYKNELEHDVSPTHIRHSINCFDVYSLSLLTRMRPR